MSARAAILGLLSLLISACTATREGGGTASYVDPLTGRQVVVETAAAGAGEEEGRALRRSYDEQLDEERAAVAAVAPAGVAARPRFSDEEYLDADRYDAQLQQRARDRFYLVPDGIGNTRVVAATALGDDGLPPPVAVAPPPANAWVACAEPLKLPLLPRRTDRRHVLEFPALAGGQRYAGYRLPVPPGATDVAGRAIIRNGQALDLLLLQVDEAGRAVAVVNNSTTESIPESAFRHASIGSKVRLPAGGLPAGHALAAVDGALARPMLSVDCLPTAPPSAAALGPPAGQVTVEFPSSVGTP